MTTLPKHFEKMRQFWIDTYELDNRQTHSAVSYIYKIDYPLEFVRPAKIIQVIEKSAVDILLKDMEEMAKALEFYAELVNKNGVDIRGVARQALKIWREKYGASDE